MERWPCWSMTDALGRAPPREDPGAKGSSLEILVRFLVPENSLGDLEQAAEFDQGRNARACGRLECLLANPTESERAETGLVSDAEQVVAFRQCTNGAIFALGEAAFGSLHQATPPGVGRGVADRAECGQPDGGNECAFGQGEGRLQREAFWVVKPRAVVFKQDGLCASNAIASRQADGASAAVQLDVHFEVSHRGTIWMFA